MRVSTKEYCLLHNVYLTAELLSQALYTRQNPIAAEANLNRALVEYKNWSEESSVRFKASHHHRSSRADQCQRLARPAKKLFSSRRRFN